jgi:aquaporin Z
MALRSTAEAGQPRANHTVTLDAALGRKVAAEFLGTALLVFFGAGVATVSFGFRAYGSSVAAGVLLTGLTFGLVALALVALLGPISGCHINPAVTLGAFLNRRISIVDTVAYWIAQLIGGLMGALLLLWVLHASPFYTRSRIGLGANGYGRLSLLHVSGSGAFLTEVVLTAVFVLVVLGATSKEASKPVAAIVIGLSLGLGNIFGLPIDGASLNPARSLGPAVVVGGVALGQLWLFLIAPMIGAVLAAGVYLLFHPRATGSPVPGTGDLSARSSLTMSGADEAEVRRAAAAEGSPAPRPTGSVPPPGSAGPPPGAAGQPPGAAGQPPTGSGGSPPGGAVGS